MTSVNIKKFRVLFIIAAFWNLTGAIPGYFDSVNTFAKFFDRELTDVLMISIYKGAWGSTLLYFFGYLMVAFNPIKHTGVVILGLVGKVFFAVMLLKLYLLGIANSLVFVVVIGDSIFSILFLMYLYNVYSLKKSDINRIN